MSIETLKNQLPDYAKDLKLNLSSLAAETVLTDSRRPARSSPRALASRNPEVIEAVIAEFAPSCRPKR